MIIKNFVEPPIGNNNYLIIDEVSKQGALIDCSSITVWDKVEEVKKNLDFEVKYILLTHGHFDHIAGIRNNPDIKVYMQKNDCDWLKKVNFYMPMFGMPEITIPEIDVFVEDNDVIKLGDLEIKVIHTPGHTQGGVCYLVENNLFTGDTIFKESVGRCDLEGGDFNQIVSSIKNKIFTLDENIAIYPGHGKPSTVGWEKLHNCFM